MKATKKTLSIEITYYDTAEMIKALNEIRTKVVHHQIRYDKDIVGQGIYEFSVEHQSYDYREEIINGKLCLVIKSKMNE